MQIKSVRQILKSMADDTRLRIVNLLNKRTLNVKQLCKILGATQSNISKHLARLRLTGVVSDKRKGVNVYYYLNNPKNKTQRRLVNTIILGLRGLKAFKKDIEKLKHVKNQIYGRR